MPDRPDPPQPSEGGSGDGRKLRWEEHNRVRRERLLQAAIDLLDERSAGAELRMAEIAERAGLRRTVMYRYFTDRHDLDAAIETEVARRLARQIVPILDVDRPIIEIIHDSIAVYVDWSEEHPGLRWILDRGAQAVGGPVQQGFSDIARVVAELVLAAIDGFDIQVTETERAYVDPLVHGLVEGVVGTVRRWVSLDDRPPAELLTHLTTESVWFLVAGHASHLGAQLEREQRLADLPAFS